MQHFSAKELFSSWYSQGLKKEINPDELVKRSAALDLLLKESDEEPANVALWMDILRLSFKEKASDQNHVRFTKFFKDNDDSFPVENNDNLVHVLSCCAVAQKIEKNESYLSDTLAIASICHKMFGKTSELQIPGFMQHNEEFYLNECREKHVMPENDLKSATQNLSKIEFKQGPGTPEFVEEVKSYLTKVSKDLQQLYGLSYLQKLNKTIAVLSEETNVLWWLFGAYSRDKRYLFNKIESYPESVARVGKELADFTDILPGFPHTDSIIAKAVQSSLATAPETSLKFSDYVNSIPEDLGGELIKNYEELLGAFIPILSSIKIRSELGYAKDETWQKLATSKYKVESGKSVSPVSMAKQLYLEIMLVRVYREI